MKLHEALAICTAPPSSKEGVFSVSLACGFTPLHFKTFLQAELQLRFPGRPVEIGTGDYGDVLGAVKLLPAQAPAAVVLEWSDLDPRLGFRQLGGWTPDLLPDMQDRVNTFLQALRHALLAAAETTNIVVSLPTLPLPPLFPSITIAAGAAEWGLRDSLSSFAASLAGHGQIRFLNPTALDTQSPTAERYDLRMDHASGFPYQTRHASALANALARLILPTAPKKGLITDLDNTLWRGVLGDDGSQGIFWDLDNKALSYGLYQQFLSSLADIGVLIGVASKNDPAFVTEAFARPDILLSAERVFPIAASWASKAQSIAGILRTWNISPDSVVFIDDDPSELAEVETAFPEMTCLRFPKDDPAAAWNMLYILRDYFGRFVIRPEDTLRLASLRNASAFQLEVDGNGFSEALLASAQGEVKLTALRGRFDERAHELMNKTNQFNLNGKRITESELRAWAEREDGVLVVGEYKDRFGPFGKIAVLLGELRDRTLRIGGWVLSCRVFSRRIEHQMLRQLFDKLPIDIVELDFQVTQKNDPVRRFLAELGSEPGGDSVFVSREQFDRTCPALHHNVTFEGLT